MNRLKGETGLRSHDEVIKELIAERKKIPRSMFGSNPKLRPFSARDEAESHELQSRRSRTKVKKDPSPPSRKSIIEIRCLCP